MNKKIILLIVSLFIGTVVIIFILSLFIDRNTLEPIVPMPEATKTPALGPNELAVIDIFPADTRVAYLPFQKITVLFNDAVSPTDLLIQTSPPTETSVLQGSKTSEIFIIPSTAWALGRTEISVLQSPSYIGSKRLKSPYFYQITTTLPTLSPEELESEHP